jgi:hypothetical protein
VVLLGTKILARLLVVHGSNYVHKFVTKTGGFIIMKHRLKRWWNLAPLWPICFSILFGQDVAKVNIERPLDLFTLLELYPGETTKVAYPEFLPIISAMLKAGIGTIVTNLASKESKDGARGNTPTLEVPMNVRKRSLSLNDQSPSEGELESSRQIGPAVANEGHRKGGKTSEKRMIELTKMLQTVIQFLSHLHSTSPNFREFCVTSNFVQELFGILFPVICSSDHVSAETELNSRDSALTFDGGDVVIGPLISNAAPPIVRTVTVEDRSPTPTGVRSERLKRGSSFVLITQEHTEYGPSSARLTPGVGSGLNVRVAGSGGYNSLIESLMELVMAVFLDTVFERREFTGFGLNMKVQTMNYEDLVHRADKLQIPPGFQEHQIYFETYLLRNTISHVRSNIGFDMRKLCEPKTLTNVARLAMHITDCIYEGESYTPIHFFLCLT